MNNKTILTLFTLLTLTVTAQENHKKCNTTKLVLDEIANNVDYATARINSNSQNLKFINTEKTTITIPVVIHIIHRSSHANIGTGTNIPDEQIEDALRILNEDFSKTNPESINPPRNTFNASWANPNIEFCLANMDPAGNITSGVTRTPTSQINWDADDNTESNAMKRSSSGGKDSWDPKRYLNIWICDLTNSQGFGMTLGYAYLPGLLGGFGQNAWKDGLVVDYRYFGTNGIAAPSSDGRTATHEIGHYLGLMHTFCEQTDASGNPICCDNDNTNWGGYVDDTPVAKDIYFGPVNSSTPNTSSVSYNTCNDLIYGFSSNLPDMHENYMSYASNTWMFSQGQVDVMIATLNTTESNYGRLSLKNSTVPTNCTGVISSTLDIRGQDISIYPNPSSGILFINSTEVISSISISNVIGKTVYSCDAVINKMIDINKLENGIYFVTLNNSITKKIFLTR